MSCNNFPFLQVKKKILKKEKKNNRGKLVLGSLGDEQTEAPGVAIRSADLLIGGGFHRGCRLDMYG